MLNGPLLAAATERRQESAAEAGGAVVHKREPESWSPDAVLLPGGSLFADPQVKPPIEHRTYRPALCTPPLTRSPVQSCASQGTLKATGVVDIEESAMAHETEAGSEILLDTLKHLCRTQHAV